MLIRDLMSKPVVHVAMDDSLQTVQRLFNAHRFHHLPVVDGGKLIGIVSDRDLLDALSPFVGRLSEREWDAATLKRRVHQIMTREVVTILPENSLRSGASRMLLMGVSCLPVVDERERCVGIITWRDILEWAIERGFLGEPDRADEGDAEGGDEEGRREAA